MIYSRFAATFTRRDSAFALPRRWRCPRLSVSTCLRSEFRFVGGMTPETGGRQSNGRDHAGRGATEILTELASRLSEG